LLTGELAPLVTLGVPGLILCGLDFVTGERSNRAFTILFAAGLIAVVGGVIGCYRRSPTAGRGHVYALSRLPRKSGG